MVILLQTGEWISPPVWVATRFHERWRGLRPLSLGRALLIRGTSVHGIGMEESLWAIGLDVEGVVLDVCLLQPGRFVNVRGVAWILEVEATMRPPPVGSVLRRVVGSGSRASE